ncbi:MAG: hypothetical protein HF978_16605 [Desulfobacteraceae bacterium]|nr:hypothetical protein [Desulfobacteraceae bacterium]MBC2757165.1 hypothetical protein [Desulfobacteraceae bacterium]
MLKTRLRIWISSICLIIGTGMMLGTGAILDTAMASTDPRPNRGSLKIEVSTPGIYRVSGSDFSSAGINTANINPDTLKMFHRDMEIPVFVSSADTVLDDSDFVEFYAAGIDNRFTGTDVYWLYWNGNTGKRMSWKNGAVNETSQDLRTFTEIRMIEENHLLWTQTPNAPEADYWFWEKFTAPQSATYTFDLPSPVNNAGQATVSVYFQGVSSTDHRTIITLNGQTIGEDIWSDTSQTTQEISITNDLLKSSRNQLTIESAGESIGAWGSVLYLNKIEVKYTRRLAALDDQLTFTLNPDDPVPVTVTGFTKNTIRVFDISDPDNVKRISGIDVQADTNSYTARFEHPGGEKTYLAVTSDAVNRADLIKYKKPYDLKSLSNQADYILITGKDLMPGLEKLCELRQRQGFRVKMVDVEDIYDVFSFGFFDPSAVHDFLKYAYENWTSPAPQYVLLAGDSNLDYRDYFGKGKENIVPVQLSATSELGLTPSDNGFVSFNDNSPVPNMYIGRISGNTSDVISKIANKIIRYETAKNYAPDQVLFVADDEERQFEDLNDDLASYLTSDYTAIKIYARLYDALEDVTENILSFIDLGMLITNFVGHGDVIRWGAEPYGGGDFIIEPGDVDDLTNPGNLTFIIALDCLNGYFSQSFDYSLAEEWVMTPETGAIACFAPSGLSHQWEHEFLSRFIFEKIFFENENRLGVITTQSKIDAYYSGASDKVLTSLNLIGDPATTLAIHRNPADMVTVYEIAASVGTGGTIAPAGDIPAFENSNETFTITPNSGYHILDVTVDGASQGTVGQYTFSNISSNHIISVEFEHENNTGGGGGGGGCFVSSLND